MKLITALILSVTAFTAQAETVSQQYVQKAQFIYDQCPKEPQTGCKDSQKMLQVCVHMKIARAATVNERDAKFYQTLDRQIKQVCGQDQ